MPVNACNGIGHDPNPSSNLMTKCRRCGADITNPTHPQAQAEGLVHGSGAPRMVNQYNANPTRTIK
jgi:hypothetical protein